MTRVEPETHFRGPVLAIDLGQKLVGAALTDELLVSIKRLDPLSRSNWKQLVIDVKELIHRFDAKTLVVGLPLRLDGTFGDAAMEASRIALNFSRSLTIPVFLQDERLTSVEANENLLAEGHKLNEIASLIDGEAAAIILRDFLNDKSPRRLVPRNSTAEVHSENRTKT